MALDGTKIEKAVMDDEHFFFGHLAGRIMIEARHHRKPVVFLTQAMEAKIMSAFPVTHYDRGQIKTMLGFPIKIVYDPDVCACWVGELVYEEDLHEEDSGQDG